MYARTGARKIRIYTYRHRRLYLRTMQERRHSPSGQELDVLKARLARRADDILSLVAEATAPVTGGEFFQVLMQKLATALGVRWAFITECVNYPTTRVRILSWWAGDGFGENIEFDLAGTPCDEVVQEGKICHHPTRVGKHFPADRYITGMEGYIGIPIFNVRGDRVIGHIAIFDDKEISDELVVESVFRVFALRAGAELQRMQAEEALRDSEEKYRLLVENQTDLIVKLDREGTLLFASPSYRDIFGGSEQSFLGTTPFSLVHEEDREATRRAWQCLFAPPHSVYARHRVSTASGWRWIAWRAKAVLDADQQVQSVVASGRDVTELRRAEEILRLVIEATSPVTGEEFFRAMMRRLAAALNVRWAFVTKCLDYPTTRVRILAYWKDRSFVDNNEFELDGTPCEQVIKEGQICFYPRDLGRVFPKESRLGRQSYVGIPIFESLGPRVIGHIAIFDDKEMSDDVLVESVFRIFAARAGAEMQRMQAAEALQASEERYRLLVENQTDLVVKVDAEGRLNFVSPSYCEMFGRTERELLGTSFLPLLAEEGSEADDVWASLFQPPYRCQVERRAMTVHGWRWLAWSAKAMPDEHGRLCEIVAGGRDITEQKRAEEQTRRHLSELAHVSRLSSMGELTSALAHELNQPLASILSYAQACLRLLRSGNADTSELQAALRRVERNTERAGQIIRHLRDLARKGEPQRTSVHVNYLVREIYRLLRPEARQQQITLLLDLAPDLDPVELDNIQIQQVILNFVRNGIDAVNASPSEKREIVIRTCRSDDGIEIAVSDTGTGIAPEVAERVFEPFVTTKPHGLGIGLSISRSIVDAHGGRLWATPNAERGTTFHMFLPGGEDAHEDKH